MRNIHKNFYTDVKFHLRVHCFRVNLMMISLNDPLFASFAFYATADVAKMMSMSLLTAAKRIRNGVRNALS